MRFLQIYYPTSEFHTRHNYLICKGNLSDRRLIDVTRQGWTYATPGTNIFNRFYLELIK